MSGGEKIAAENINIDNKHNFFQAIDANKIADTFNIFRNAISLSDHLNLEDNIFTVNITRIYR